MAILAIFTGKGMDKDAYDALRREVDWERDRPAGGIFHAAAFDNDGNAHVADVWASQDALDAFVAGKLMPAMQKLNVPPPDVQVFPIHKVDAYDAVKDYIVK